MFKIIIHLFLFTFYATTFANIKNGGFETNNMDNWTHAGDLSQIEFYTKDQFKGKQCLKIEASPTDNRISQIIPHHANTQLYKIELWIKTNLHGTTKFQMGLDFLDSEKKHIRQAHTYYRKGNILETGFFSLTGKSNWHKQVAWVTRIKKNTKFLKLWLSVNAWNTPEAKGSVLIDHISITPQTPSSKYLLAYPPKVWKSQKSTDQTTPYQVFIHSINKYVLPNMDQTVFPKILKFNAISYPGDIHPLTFSLRAEKEMKDIKIKVSKLTQKYRRKVQTISQIKIKKAVYLYKKDNYMTMDYLKSPNHLENFDHVTIGKGQLQQFWIDIHVPESAKPGLYKGNLEIYSNNQILETREIELKILNIKLKQPKDMSYGMFSYDTHRAWKGDYNMQRDYRKQIDADFKDMKEHSMTTTVTFNPYIKTPIQFINGKPQLIWKQESSFYQVLESYNNSGLSGPLILIAPEAFYDVSKKHGGPLGSAGFKKVFSDILSDLRSKLNQKKWKNLIFIPADGGYPYLFAEERYLRTKYVSPLLKKHHFPVAICSFNHPIEGARRFEKEFLPFTDYIALTFAHPPICGSEESIGYKSFQQYREAMEKLGKKIIFYNPDVSCIHPEATRFSHGLALWKTKAKGIINWCYREVNQFKPKKKPGYTTRSMHYLPGFGYQGGPTIAWETSREGIDDYSILYTFDNLLKKSQKKSKKLILAIEIKDKIDKLLVHLDFTTIKTNSYLILGNWQKEFYDQKGQKILHGEFKINNGINLNAYDQVRNLALQGINLLQN